MKQLQKPRKRSPAALIQALITMAFYVETAGDEDVPVKFRIEFKILLLTYKALNDQAPSYLKDLIVG